MTHNLSNLPEAYEKIVENIEDNLDNNNDLLTINSIREKLLVKYNQMKNIIINE